MFANSLGLILFAMVKQLGVLPLPPGCDTTVVYQGEAISSISESSYLFLFYVKRATVRKVSCPITNAIYIMALQSL